MNRILIATLISSFTLFAQTQPRTPPSPTELKAALTLTDSQATQLQQLQQERIAANREIFEQIRTKQQELNTLVRQTAPDATALGQLMLEIKALRARIQTSDEAFRNQALALLTTDQRTKLQALEDAMKLQPAAHQAIGLNLLDAATLDHGPRMHMPGPGGPGGFGAPRMEGGAPFGAMQMRSPKR